MINGNIRDKTITKSEYKQNQSVSEILNDFER